MTTWTHGCGRVSPGSNHGSCTSAIAVLVLAMCLRSPTWGFAVGGSGIPGEAEAGPLTQDSASGGRGGDVTEAPARLMDRSRDGSLVRDFLRLTFLPSGVTPTKLGGPNATWVFVGASSFYRPALPLGELLQFPGLTYEPGLTLFAMRCLPWNPSPLEPTLATWPRVAAIIAADLGGAYSCPPPAGGSGSALAENAMYCVAKGFTDTPHATVVASLQTAADLVAALFLIPGSDQVFRRRYGIFPAFSGLGFAVKGSGDGHLMTAAEVLQQSITPEYLVRNLTLAEGACSCIGVPPYPGREIDPLDVDFIVREGGQGECRVVDRLH